MSCSVNIPMIILNGVSIVASYYFGEGCRPKSSSSPSKYNLCLFPSRFLIIISFYLSILLDMLAIYHMQDYFFQRFSGYLLKLCVLWIGPLSFLLLSWTVSTVFGGLGLIDQDLGETYYCTTVFESLLFFTLLALTWLFQAVFWLSLSHSVFSQFASYTRIQSMIRLKCRF